MCNIYNDLYDYDWNLDGTVTRVICNKRYRMSLDANISTATRSSVSGPNNLKFIWDDQDDLLKYYKDKYEEDTRLFLQFMEHDNSSPPPLNKKYSQRKRKSTDFLIDNHSSKKLLEKLSNHLKITKLTALMMNI